MRGVREARGARQNPLAVGSVWAVYMVKGQAVYNGFRITPASGLMGGLVADHARSRLDFLMALAW